jgi:hypothetical protein
MRDAANERGREDNRQQARACTGPHMHRQKAGGLHAPAPSLWAKRGLPVIIRIAGPLSLAGVFLLTLLLVSVVTWAATKSQDRYLTEQLIVRNITPGQDVTDHEWGIVRLEMGLEKNGAPDSGRKTKFPRSPLRVKVDNKEVSCYVVDSATGYDGKKTYAYRTVAIRLGAQPGPRVITVLYHGLVKSIPITYNPSGQLEFADLYDHQAILGKKPVTIHWFGCYLPKESVKISVNDKVVPADMDVPQDAPELLAGRISPGEKLKPGANKVRIEALDIRGNKRERDLVFYYYPDNRVPLGDEFALSLGLEEPKNGPFYDAVVEGGSIQRTHQLGQRPGPERMGGQMIVPPGKAVLAWFKAVRPGESTIATMVKQYSTDEPMEVERARVAVYPMVPSPSLHAADAPSLEKYLQHLPFWPLLRTGH